MNTFNNSIGNNDSKSIYDITHKIEEELTYIYEIRMKQYVNSAEIKESSSDAMKQKQNDILKNEQTTSKFAR